MSLNRLFLKASDRDGKPARCTFTAKKDDVSELATNDPADPAFDIPDGTSTVRVTFKP